MGFVVDEVTLDRVFSEYSGSPLSVLFHQCSQLYLIYPPRTLHNLSISFIPYVVLLATGPWPLLKRGRPTVRSSASSLKLQYLPCFLKVMQQLFSSSSSSSHPSYVSFTNVFQKAGPAQDMTNPVVLPLLYSMQDIPFLLALCLHTVGPTDFLYPSNRIFM